MNRTFPHGLSLPAAKQITRIALADYQRKLAEYAVSVAWASDATANVTFVILNTVIKGVISVTALDIEIEVDVPLKLKLFEGVALKAVEKEIRACIDNAKQANAQAAR